MRDRKGKILIIVENLPIPFDTRVWQEATTLVANGYVVSVICPKGKGYEAEEETLEGVHIFRHDMPEEGNGAIGYLKEYSCALKEELRLAKKVYQTIGFDVIQGCNPPDDIYLVAGRFKKYGVKYVFDHHDICPELFEAKFGRAGGPLYFSQVFLERQTYKHCVFSFATNQSYRQIAIERGKMDPEKVIILRSGPKLERMKILPPVESIKRGYPYMVGYVGVIGQQEGIQYLLGAADYIKKHDNNVFWGIVGGGPHLEAMKQQAHEMGLDDCVEFTGRAPDQQLLEYLNTADVCVNCDEHNSMNDKSTMNKVLEYMALGKPIVQFDLTEGRYSAGEASLYAENNNAEDMAKKIIQLLEDPELRQKMGAYGRGRVLNELSWEHTSRALLEGYEKFFSGAFDPETEAENVGRTAKASKITWMFRRLKAMSIPEILWRLSQKKLQKQEEKQFGAGKTPVTDKVFQQKLEGLFLDPDRLHLNLENRTFSLNTEIPLLGPYAYSEYKDQWNAGFQTENSWPDTFSGSLEYKQRDDIGDARTNWELNRHFQFAQMAKDYAASGEKQYLNELTELFEDWNQKNPFLRGISWTSVMEIAIRCSSWCYTYCFLVGAEDVPEKLLQELKTGILNMTAYIADHYSRYSSANNHLIVEAYAIGQSGILFDNSAWTDLAVSTLTRELTLQNYSDGINRELSLHYQSFYMEAMGLMMRLMGKNHIAVPDSWVAMLQKMCRYLADCIGAYGEVVEFGDNDEGKILDLTGGQNHYEYVLQMFGVLLEERYTDAEPCETVRWLFTESELREAEQKPLYTPPLMVSYEEGGNTILRSSDHKVLIGIDHAALGFGSLAAHGHADALSFQLYYEGKPVFVDPGTYIYHCWIHDRDFYRKSINHNTVVINGCEQSEMLGAFLWGKKAEAHRIAVSLEDDTAEMEAEVVGQSGIKHKRTYTFHTKTYEFRIEDTFERDCGWTESFLLPPGLQVKVEGGRAEAAFFELVTEQGTVTLEDSRVSRRYGMQEPAEAVRIRGRGTGNKVIWRMKT